MSIGTTHLSKVYAVAEIIGENFRIKHDARTIGEILSIKHDTRTVTAYESLQIVAGKILVLVTTYHRAADLPVHD